MKKNYYHQPGEIADLVSGSTKMFDSATSVSHLIIEVDKNEAYKEFVREHGHRAHQEVNLSAIERIDIMSEHIDPDFLKKEKDRNYWYVDDLCKDLKEFVSKSPIVEQKNINDLDVICFYNESLKDYASYLEGIVYMDILGEKLVEEEWEDNAADAALRLFEFRFGYAAYNSSGLSNLDRIDKMLVSLDKDENGYADTREWLKNTRKFYGKWDEHAFDNSYESAATVGKFFKVANKLERECIDRIVQGMQSNALGTYYKLVELKEKTKPVLDSIKSATKECCERFSEAGLWVIETEVTNEFGKLISADVVMDLDRTANIGGKSMRSLDQVKRLSTPSVFIRAVDNDNELTAVVRISDHDHMDLESTATDLSFPDLSFNVVVNSAGEYDKKFMSNLLNEYQAMIKNTGLIAKQERQKNTNEVGIGDV